MAPLCAQVEGGRPVLRLAVAGCDCNVHLFRLVASGGAGDAWVPDVSLPSVHKEWVRDVAWVPSGGMPYNMFASCSEVLLTAARVYILGFQLMLVVLQDKTVVIWKQTEAGGAWSPTALPEFPAPVWRVSWSITGNILAVSCGNDSVTLWKENLARKWERVSHVAQEGAPGK
jgi:protein transport protein SEC13